MSEEGYPPEIQKEPEEFAFHELCHLKVMTTDQRPNYDVIRSNLLAVSNRYGYIFVGTPEGLKVFLESDVIHAAKSNSKVAQLDSNIATISFKNLPHWLGLSIDEYTLCACCRTEKGPQILFFDTRNIVNTAKPSKAPFYQQHLSKDGNSYVTDLKWNPCEDFPNSVAVCLSSGSFHLLSIGETDVSITNKPDSFGASAVYWSQDGKYVMVGKKDGTLAQFTQALEPCQSISVTNVIDKSVKTCDLIWLSTNQVGAAYVACDDDSFNQPNLFLANIPKPGEDTLWKNYEDPCFGMGESRESQYFFAFIQQWQMIVVLCSNSTGIAVIAKNMDTEIWEIWTLNDSSRAALPMSSYTEDDSAPIGVGIITTATDKIVLGESKECGPMPVMLVLTDDGILCSYRMINLMESYSNFVKSPEPLGLSGERSSTMFEHMTPSTGEAVGEKMNRVPLKKKLTAKPSVSPMAASKSVSSLPPSHPSKLPFSSSTPLLGKMGHVPLFSEEPSIIKEDGRNHPKLTSTNPGFPKLSSQLKSNEDFSTNESRFASGPQPISRFATKSDSPVFTSQEGSKSVKGSRSSSGPQKVTSFPIISENTIKTAISPKSSKSLTGSRSASSSQPASLFSSRENATNSEKTSKRLNSTFSATKGVIAHEETMSRKLKTSSDLNAMFDDIASFDAEMKEFKSSVKGVENCHGGVEQRSEFVRLEKLMEFSSDIRKTTKDLANEIQDTSTSLHAMISDAEGIKQKFSSQALGSYRMLMYSRPLDRLRREKLKAIQDLYQYIVSCTKNVNSTLDCQWDEARKRTSVTLGVHGENKCTSKPAPLKMTEWEAAYQALRSNMKMLHDQELKITLLSQKLDRLRVSDASRSTRFTDKMASLDELSGNLQTLADTLLSRKVPDPKLAGKQASRKEVKKQQKLSLKKQALLGQFLAKRKVTVVNATGRRTGSIMRPCVTRRDPIVEVVTSFSPTTEESSSDYEDAGFSHETMYPAASSTVVPQGSATFGYGAPLSAKVDMKRRDLASITLADHVQAASNLNNPPQVVNIQTCSDSIPPQPQLPEIFEPSPQVPIGAVEVVQTVLNMVKSEKNPMQKDFGTKGKDDRREQMPLDSQPLAMPTFNTSRFGSQVPNKLPVPDVADSTGSVLASVSSSPFVSSAPVTAIKGNTSYLERTPKKLTEENPAELQTEVVLSRDMFGAGLDSTKFIAPKSEKQKSEPDIPHVSSYTKGTKVPSIFLLGNGGNQNDDNTTVTESGNEAEKISHLGAFGTVQSVPENSAVSTSSLPAPITSSAQLSQPDGGVFALAATSVSDSFRSMTGLTQPKKVSENTSSIFGHQPAVTAWSTAAPLPTQTNVSSPAPSLFGNVVEATSSVTPFQSPAATVDVSISGDQGIGQNMDENIPSATDEVSSEVPALSSASQSLLAPTGFGAFSISGFGQKPTAESAGHNPFGVTPQSDVKTNASLFGSNPQQPSSFGAASQFPSFMGLKSSTNSVASQGFVFSKPQQSQFGAGPSFGGSALFGSPPSFGSSTFGMQSSSGVFGQSSGGGFESFGKAETLGFGSLANQNNVGMQQQSGFFQNKFNTNPQTSPSFSGWR